MKKIFALLILIITIFYGCTLNESKPTILFQGEKSKNLVTIYENSDGSKVYSEFADIKFRKNNNL